VSRKFSPLIFPERILLIPSPEQFELADYSNFKPIPLEIHFFPEAGADSRDNTTGFLISGIFVKQLPLILLIMHA
jgi:hypothetical protein